MAKKAATPTTVTLKHLAAGIAEEHELSKKQTEAILGDLVTRVYQAAQTLYPNADADLIIAATAMEHGRVLVTGNTPHFAWISGLRLEDWRQP